MLVTRGGELFTWGSGHGGKLGLGHMMDAHSPQRVHTLWGQSIKHVAAGGTDLARSPSAALSHAAVCALFWWRQQGICSEVSCPAYTLSVFTRSQRHQYLQLAPLKPLSLPIQF